ncbi:MAG: Gfo/Idh/MocA family oxidoreductase [candidate division WOR-3 bacterium]
MMIRQRIRTFVQGHTTRVRVGFAGSGPLMDLVVQGYRQHSRAVLAAAYHPDRTVSNERASTWGCEAAYDDYYEFLSSVNMVEFGELPEEHRGLAAHAVKAGKHVSLPKPLTRTVSEAEGLLRDLSGSSARVRVNDPFLFYPPYLKVKELLDRREIGEPASIRIKATLGRGGRWPCPPLPNDSNVEGYLCHPCLDRFSLAIFLLGTVDRVSAYANSLHGERGGQILVSFKYTHPGRYGVLDRTVAPHMYVRSDYFPVHDTVEIAGTDGLIWVNHCMGKMTEEPPIVVRLARRYYQIGVECELKTDFSDCFYESARDFLTAIVKSRPHRSGISEAGKGLRFLLRAAESVRSGNELAVR